MNALRPLAAALAVLGLDAGAGFSTSLDKPSVTLAAGASTTVTATVTIPAAYLTPSRAMESREAAFTVQEAGKG